jgi:hypothetical protein
MNSIDHLQYFPDELTSGCNGECVGFTRGDIIANIYNRLMDIEFSYASGLYMTGAIPSTGGEDPYAGMVADTIFGALPTADETFSIQNSSQLFDANFANYTLQQKALAKQYATNAVKLLGSYSEIIAYLNRYQQGASLAMRWYESFMTPNADGTLPATGGSYTYHNVGVWGADARGLQIKPYINPSHSTPPTWGQGGYCYLTEANFNMVEEGAWGYDPNAWRWLFLARSAMRFPQRIPDILPILLNSR